MKLQGRVAVAVVALAVVSFGCSSADDSGARDSTESGADESLADRPDDQGQAADLGSVDVSVKCTRGDSLGTAPADTAAIGFLEGVSDDTAWVQRTVTVDNGSSAARVDPGLLIRYLDESGELISEQALDEPFPPALAAAAGQSVNRNTIRFDVPAQEGLVSDSAVSGELFASLGSCEVGGEPTVEPVADGEFIDPDFSGQVELIECGLTDDGGAYEGTFRVQNPSDEPINVELGFEILGPNGERLGIGANESDPVPANSEATITAFAAAFTVLDIDDAVDCELLTALVV